MILIPVWIFVPVFLVALDADKPWYWFTGLTAGLIVATLLWSFALKAAGITDRLLPPEPAI